MHLIKLPIIDLLNFLILWDYLNYTFLYTINAQPNKICINIDINIFINTEDYALQLCQATHNFAVNDVYL